MEDSFGEYHYKRIREEISGGSTVDRTFRCHWDDLNLVLNDWNKLKPNLNKLGLDVFQRFVGDHLSYKELFPTIANIPEEYLFFNEDFRAHSFAIMQGLNSIMKNLSAEYEDDNEILPIIGFTHQKRGITPSMMNHLKESILSTLTEVLDSDRKEKAAWSSVLDFIFEDYILKVYTTKEEVENLEKENKKPVTETKSERRNSSFENYDKDGPFEEEKKDRSSQVMTFPSDLMRKYPLITKSASPTLSDRRPSKSLLHPDHAKLMVQRRSSLLTPPMERYNLPIECTTRAVHNGGFITSPLSSSAASSVISISNGPALESHISDPLNNYESRRSSTITNKYSLLDALDLEYALIKAAARGSIGPYSLSQSLQKLTFTQSLAFPALARGLSNKKNPTQNNSQGPLDPLDSGVNAFAKIATVLVLVLISILVFGVLYKFIRT